MAYVDESDKLLILKEFTVPEFAEWFAVQNLGAAPYNGVGFHHTYRPTSKQYLGIRTLQGVFNYYRDSRGWPYGKGPHIWGVSADNPHRPGTPLVLVGTHPRYDGIGISYRNQRWLHFEMLTDGDAAALTPADQRLARDVLRILCKRRGQEVTINHGPSLDNPSTWQGVMFHRDARTNIKTCPGSKNTHALLDEFFMEPETQTPLLRRSSVPMARAQRYVAAGANGTYTDLEARRIVHLYYTLEPYHGLDSALLVAQMAHETDRLSSEWSQPPHHNPAGIGVTGELGKGVSFEDWRHAVACHVGRILAYALKPGEGTAAQKMLIAEALRVRPLPDSYRGIAPTLEKLTGTWATDPAYHLGVLKHLQAMREA